MINVKLVVLLFCIDFVACSTNYCGICPNHTLCKYTMPGPSSTCQEYTETPITKEDEDNIINKINERRNFVASGLSRMLPQAANINKIYWSKQLAVMAQRWADQCDGYTHPDKEDQCRDLADVKVGQNIVSVAGPTPGLLVTSLVDVWLMQSLDYTGSVTYYNQSRDWKTNYFTQLIWAETDQVGCGRARFHVEEKNSIIERLVCNFAPRGNIDGRPVYAIGYPATQCPRDKLPDRTFTSLCAYFTNSNRREVTRTTKIPTVSSLLRILNLSNNSVKPEIDPIRNKLKQMKFDANETSEQRNQKTRHVFFNNSHGFLEKPPPLLMQNQWNTLSNHSRRQRLQQYQQERGHSRVYHGHDMQIDNNHSEPDNKKTTNHYYPTHQNYLNEGEIPTNNNYRKNDQASWTFLPSRKYNRNLECTRRSGTIVPDCAIAPDIGSQCTRNHKEKNCLHVTQLCQTETPCKVTNSLHSCSHNLCNTPRTTFKTLPPECNCHVNFQCRNIELTSSQCPFLRYQDYRNNDETRKSMDDHHCDLVPNLAIRSGDREIKKVSPMVFEPSVKDTWLQHDIEIAVDGTNKRSSPKIKYDHEQVLKERFEHKSKNIKDYEYIYHPSYSRERKKRNPVNEVTFKPFWQMDEFNRDRSTLLKSLRFTTLNKKSKKNKQITTSIKKSQTTESITVQLKDGSIKPNHKNRLTEKYLSFDELMHLRKLSTTQSSTHIQTSDTNINHYVSVDARRADTPKTEEYTTNTPFMRKKHCTRKLTCTWTAPTVVGMDGSVIVPGIGGDRGSRTPPGYVEGCTRTSTCTRDFMDRNKFATISDEVSADITQEDEDYCEKRALDVKKRDSNVEDMSYSDAKHHFYTEVPYPTYFTYAYTIDNIDSSYATTKNTVPSLLEDNCVCNEQNTRTRRNERSSNVLSNEFTIEKNSPDNLSYGDLYYLVLQKIIEKWKNKQSSNHNNVCSCNSATLIKCSVALMFFIFFYNTLITLFI